MTVKDLAKNTINVAIILLLVLSGFLLGILFTNTVNREVYDDTDKKCSLVVKQTEQFMVQCRDMNEDMWVDGCYSIMLSSVLSEMNYKINEVDHVSMKGYCKKSLYPKRMSGSINVLDL